MGNIQDGVCELYGKNGGSYSFTRELEIQNKFYINFFLIEGNM